MTDRTVAVVGAGIAGLACAQALQQAGLAVQVVEKSRGPGGRMSTRRGEGWQADHGAPAFSAASPAFQAELQRWQQAGVAARWAPLQRAGDPPHQAHPAHPVQWVGLPRMSAPAAWLASGLQGQPGCSLRALSTLSTVSALQPLAGGGWQLQTAEQGLLADRFNAVLLAIPAPQALALLQGLAVQPALAALQPAAAGLADLTALAARGRMRPCWTLMLRFDAPPVLPFASATFDSGPLHRLWRDSDKPGRGGAETWVVQAGADWTEAHLEDSPEAASAALLQDWAALGGPPPQACTAHRWRYAQAAPLAAGTGTTPVDGACWDAGLDLGLCGDWLQGGGVEGAWRSGRALADEVGRWDQKGSACPS